MRCCSSCRCVGSACSRRPSMSSVCLLPTALAVLTSVHHPRACARAGTQVWAWQSMRGHAWACARTKKVVRCDRSALATQVEHAHGYVVWAHHHLCAFDQLEYRVSSEPSSMRVTRLVLTSSASSRTGHLLVVSWHGIVGPWLMWPNTAYGGRAGACVLR